MCRGDLRQVQTLIQSGVDVNEWTWGGSYTLMLLLAIEAGYQGIALALLAAGADVHAKGRVGQSALHWACKMGLEEVVQVLINRRS